MSQDLNVTRAELHRLEAALERMKGTLTHRIGVLNGVVEGISASWRGDAAAAYQALQRQVNDDARRLNEILESIREAVAAAKSGFAVGEQEQSSRFRNLHGAPLAAGTSILDALS